MELHRRSKENGQERVSWLLSMAVPSRDHTLSHLCMNRKIHEDISLTSGY